MLSCYKTPLQLDDGILSETVMEAPLLVPCQVKTCKTRKIRLHLLILASLAMHAHNAHRIRQLINKKMTEMFVQTFTVG